MIKEEWGKENRKSLTRENKYQGHVVLTQQTAETFLHLSEVDPRGLSLMEMFICPQSVSFQSLNQLNYFKPYSIHLPLKCHANAFSSLSVQTSQQAES